MPPPLAPLVSLAPCVPRLTPLRHSLGFAPFRGRGSQSSAAPDGSDRGPGLTLVSVVGAGRSRGRVPVPEPRASAAPLEGAGVIPSRCGLPVAGSPLGRGVLRAPGCCDYC